jgi:hypothetical protein
LHFAQDGRKMPGSSCRNPKVYSRGDKDSR